MHRYPIKTAAQLAEASYTAATHVSVAPHIQRSLTDGDVEAHFLRNGVLLIPGTNSIVDYLKFNLRVLNIGGSRYSVRSSATEKGDSGTLWHQGFLRHAKAIFDWMALHDQVPKYIIGHSLGAAATQILSKSYRVPGIGFAAPRPRKHSGPLVDDELCLCINRDDDVVTRLPGSFNHMGRVFRARGRTSVFGPDHRMAHYRNVVKEQQSARLLQAKWP